MVIKRYRWGRHVSLDFKLCTGTWVLKVSGTLRSGGL